MENLINEKFIGKKVIIRSNSAGVFFGTLEGKSGNEVILSNCRRIWRWEEACSISQIANDGVGKDSKIAMNLDQILISEVIEIALCTEKASECLENIEVWKI